MSAKVDVTSGRGGLKRQGVLLCLVGPAGSGKTTIGQDLLHLEKGTIRQSISVTSRTPRNNEVNGVHYHFVSPEQFKKMAADGDFFEWEEIHGNCYGTPRKPLEETIAGGVDLLLIIDIVGARNVKKAYPKNACIVFVTPLSHRELEKRIASRGGALPDEVKRRLATARDEYERLLQDCRGEKLVDYLLVNEQVQEASAEFRKMLHAERNKIERISDKDVESLCIG